MFWPPTKKKKKILKALNSLSVRFHLENRDEIENWEAGKHEAKQSAVNKDEFFAERHKLH